MRPAYGYIRVSSDEQADSGLGLEAQRQCIRAYCELKGLQLTTLFEDPAVSGGKPLSSRPAGSRLLADARRNRAVVIVAKFDRLFRSVSARFQARRQTLGGRFCYRHARFAAVLRAAR